MTANVSFRYLERRHGVCEDVRRVASFSGPALRTCLGFKGRTFSSDVKAQSEGMDGGPERSNSKQRKVLQKADKTQRKRKSHRAQQKCFWGHINVTDQMTETQRPKHTLKRLKVHRYKSQ